MWPINGVTSRGGGGKAARSESKEPPETELTSVQWAIRNHGRVQRFLGRTQHAISTHVGENHQLRQKYRSVSNKWQTVNVTNQIINIYLQQSLVLLMKEDNEVLTCVVSRHNFWKFSRFLHVYLWLLAWVRNQHHNGQTQDKWYQFSLKRLNV